MNSKIILSILAVVVLAGGAGFILYKDRPTGEGAITASGPSTSTVPTPAPVAEPTPTVPEVAITPTPNLAPAPTPKPTPSGPKTYSMSQVAAHSTESNCWSVVGGDVYDLTSWISRHPGGSEAIIAMCGKDATNIYNGQHDGAKKPKAMLILLKIGSLAT